MEILFGENDVKFNMKFIYFCPQKLMGFSPTKVIFAVTAISVIIIISVRLLNVRLIFHWIFFYMFIIITFRKFLITFCSVEFRRIQLFVI